MDLETISQQLANKVADDKDALIMASITAAIGHDQWTVADMLGRLSTQRRERIEVFFLDDCEILELHPVKVKKIECGESVKVKCTRQYRHLAGTPKDG